MSMEIILQIIAIIVPLVFAITVHEAAHGYVAKGFGDSTAYRQGRLTLNPIAHIDLTGTIIIPSILVYLGGLVFGWQNQYQLILIIFLDQKEQCFLWHWLAHYLIYL